MSVSLRQENKAKTRKRLLKAGLALFIDEGVGGLTMNRISREAGISQPSFYGHFENLQEMAGVLRQQIIARYMPPVEAALRQVFDDKSAARAADLGPRLQAFVTLIFETLLNDYALFSRLMADQRAVGVPLAGELGKVIREVREIWFRLFQELTLNVSPEISSQQLQLMVDTGATLTHELVTGCHQGRYSQQDAVKHVSGILNHLLVSGHDFSFSETAIQQ